MLKNYMTGLAADYRYTTPLIYNAPMRKGWLLYLIKRSQTYKG